VIIESSHGYYSRLEGPETGPPQGAVHLLTLASHLAMTPAMTEQVLVHEGHFPDIALHRGILMGASKTRSRKNFATYHGPPVPATVSPAAVDDPPPPGTQTNDRSGNSPELGSRTSREMQRLDAVLLGDSWVDSVWGNSVETWPVRLCKHRRWCFLNVAQAGTTTASVGQAQLDVIEQQLQEKNLVTDNETLWILHAGGNDMLHRLPADWLQVEMDVVRMHVARTTALGGSLMRDWLLAGEKSKSTFTRGSSMFGRNATLIADRTAVAMNNMKQRFGAKKFLVSSNTISSAMPLCRALSFAVTPFRGRTVLDCIALICALRLTAVLDADFGLNDVEVKFYDEQAVCVKRRAEMSWQRDGFHPLGPGHAILAGEATAVVDDNTGSYLISAAAARKIEEMDEMCAECGAIFGILGLVEIVLTTVQVAVIGVPLTIFIMLVNLISFLSWTREAMEREVVVEVVSGDCDIDEVREASPTTAPHHGPSPYYTTLPGVRPRQQKHSKYIKG